MKTKYIPYFTKPSSKKIEFHPSKLVDNIFAYLKKVIFYAKIQLVKRKRSYKSMFIISVVLLSFVFTNLMLHETQIMGNMSNSGGTYHVKFLGIDKNQADGAVGNRRVTNSLTIPVIAEMESSVDSSTVGKVAVLTDEIIKFMNIHISHGGMPDDNEIIVTQSTYSINDYLVLGEKSDMYFSGREFIYYPMATKGIYDIGLSADKPYIFVNEATGEEIRKACGTNVKYDVYMLLNYASDRNAGKVVGDIARKYKITDNEEQKRHNYDNDRQNRSDINMDRYTWSEYIGPNINYRFTSDDVNSLVSLPALIAAAFIMSSFMKSYTERHIDEYGVLASYGAKRRHLFGIIICQFLFITVLSFIPVSVISSTVCAVYAHLCNTAHNAGKLPVALHVPYKTLISMSLKYLIILCLVSYIIMKRMLSQFPYAMVRGSTAVKLKFVSKSFDKIERIKNKVGRISVLQSVRCIRQYIVPSAAISIIVILCSVFIGYTVLKNLQYSSELNSYKNNIFSGNITASRYAELDENSARGYITESDMEYLRSVDGVMTVGGMRQADYSILGYKKGNLSMLIDRAHFSYVKFQYELDSEEYININPYYCDRDILDSLYTVVFDGDVNAIYDNPYSMIIIDNMWADDENHYHAGDTVSLRVGDSTDYEMTVAAVAGGTYVVDIPLTLTNCSVIMSPEAGEIIDGFPADVRKTVYFTFKPDLTDDECKNTAAEIAENANIIRYDLKFYDSVKLKVSRSAAIDNVMNALFFISLYLAMCVLDYYSSSDIIKSKRREICTLRQIGASDKDIYKTTRSFMYAGQVLSVGFTVIFGIIIFNISTAYMTNMRNTYYMNIPQGPALDAIIEELNETYKLMQMCISAVVVIAILFHVIAFATAVAATILPTKQILKDDIAQTLKGSADL